MTKRLAILGSTGSIGTSTLKVVSAHSERLSVTGLVAGSRGDALAAQARSYAPSWLYAATPEALAGQELPPHCRVLSSQDELVAAVCADDVDIVLCAIVGTAGLRPVLEAIKAGKDIALASKEILVMAGALVTAAAAKSGSRILPVDSEHCAIFQCLDQHPRHELKRIILTASGGPFHSRPELDLSRVSVDQALAHPTWSMGRKITIDSATLMNKGLELIEAGWLFGLPEDRIEVVIHPQSIIHSMVEFRDNSILAQMGYPDMALPIQYCLTYPERLPCPVQAMDFSKSLQLSFTPPDNARFPALTLARHTMRAGGAMGAVFNAANEVAVERFCQREIPFSRITEIVAKTMGACANAQGNDLAEILTADQQARIYAVTA
ncbi:MAG: 1-deoxy-D-xylulose-5-phosphate reductoisomerase [Lentisphaerae bacterium]|nr:1-deoxy-D-xylulose-5-phosphate reductoisomerase [Lentisphaerota bacterium]